MSWTPNQDGVNELISVLRDSTSEDSAVQAQVTKRLESFESIPDYPGYLVHILTHLTNEDERFRSVAGLLLKNNLGALSTANSPAMVAYVKDSVLSALGDPVAMVRQTVGTVIVSLLNDQGVESWTEALAKLMGALDSPNSEEQEGAFSTLTKVCEDLPKELDIEISGQRLLDFMIPRFIQFTDHPSAKFRTQAISCLNSFIITQPPSLNTSIDAFFTALFRRASDENSDVRKAVCQALTLLLSTRPDKIVPELPNVAEFMIYSMQDKDESVALEACEFWLGFAEADELKDHLKPFLGKVAPVLLNGMVYSEADLIWLDGDDDDDAAVPDRPEDIKPKFYGGKGHGFEHDSADPSSSGGKSRALGEDGEEEDDDDDYDDDSDDDEDDFSSEWNLRKCSAAALDVMSVVFDVDLLEILLPHLKDKLFSQEWTERECGILALGAMAEGCLDGITPHLPTLVPLLLSTLADPKPLVRAITCWTLGRYSSWCVNASTTAEAQAQFFLPTMEGLLKAVLDNNKRVQEAGCSAFATLEEEAGARLQPFLDPIIRNLVFAFSKYQQKNLLILYDAIGTLADSVGEGLNDPNLVGLLMPPMIEKWNALGDDDEAIIPLLECLSSVSISAAEAFAPYAIPIYERSLKLVQKSLAEYIAFRSGQAEEPDKTFLIVSLDLLSGLTQGLKENLSTLMAPAGTPPGQLPVSIQLLQSCLDHPDAPVRQSAYAMLGDMAINCRSLNDYLPLYLPRISKEISDQVAQPKFEEVSVCNNAAWALGEIAMQCQAKPDNPTPALRGQLEPHVPLIVECLIRILLNTSTPKSLLENAAVTIGRLGLIFPELVAVHLGQFGKTWCSVLWDIKDNDEKASAFMGFCQLVMVNPNAILGDLIYLCNAICKWTTPSQELNATFAKVLTSFKSMLGETWDQNFPTFPPALQERLRQRYNL